MTYVKFEAPKDLIEKALEALETASTSGKIKKGTNEVTKAVERSNAKLVVIGSDVNPPEIVMHLPMISEEKNTPYIYAPKAEIGEAVGIHVPSAAACIVEEGDSEDLVEEIVEKVQELK